MNKKRILRTLQTGLISGVVAILLTSCETTPTKPNLYGKVKLVQQEEIIDQKTGVITVVEKEYLEVAARSLTDDGQDTSATAQLVGEIGSYFADYDVHGSKGILATIPNGTAQKGSDLWIINNGKTRLTKTGYYHNTPSFSENGNFVLFTSRRGKKVVSEYAQDSYIWRMRSSGTGGITQVGSPSFLYQHPFYSFDQSKILAEMVSLRGENPFIWYMESNGSLPTQLTPGESPIWLSDDTIAFCSKDEITGRYCIWTTKLDGSLLTQLICDPEHHCIHASPHPHGRYIAFVKQPVSTSNPQERNVFVYDVENGTIQQVTTNHSRDDLPNWSEDGSMLYFRSSRGLSWNIWRVPLTDFDI